MRKIRIRIANAMLALLTLTNCSHAPTKGYYQNTFWIGCMNAGLFYSKPRSPKKIDILSKWCTKQYEKVKDL